MSADVRIAKVGGDDAYSWAVLVDDRPVVSEVTRQDAAHHRDRVRELLRECEQD